MSPGVQSASCSGPRATQSDVLVAWPHCGPVGVGDAAWVAVSLGAGVGLGAVSVAGSSVADGGAAVLVGAVSVDGCAVLVGGWLVFVAGTAVLVAGAGTFVNVGGRTVAG